MLSTQGIDAIASVSELKSNAADLVSQAGSKVILVQGSDASAILIGHEAYLKLIGVKPAKKVVKKPATTGTGRRGRPKKNVEAVSE
jgi:hypothetical protein